MFGPNKKPIHVPEWMGWVQRPYLPYLYSACKEYIENHPEMVDGSPQKMAYESIRDGAEYEYNTRNS
jgi:hypothetical protein